MLEVITLIIFLLSVLIYFSIVKNKGKRYGNSAIFYIIEKVYEEWYSRKNNGHIINKKNVTKFEVDRVIFELKKSLIGRGINKLI